METRAGALKNYFFSKIHASSLAVFRISFGLLMFISMIRFWYNGWIEKLYIDPPFHFHYYGFEFITVPGKWTYALFILCGLSALFVALGYRYRLSIILFFLSFTYIELMDKTTYLNHYYFISVLSFILIWLPASCYFSIDSLRQQSQRFEYVPKWNVDVLKVLLAIVYIYAGAAKLNYDWMVNAMPLSLWLPSKYGIPILSDFFHLKWVHYAFSWGGAIYDLSIVFLLLYAKTRVLGYFFVIVFHVLTGVLFPIGMFPYVMITATLIFFSSSFHQKLLTKVSKLFNKDINLFNNGRLYNDRVTFLNLKVITLSIVLMLQLLIPLRFLAYPNHLFWTEEGYRFSWRVMLMEKTGYANFKIVNGETQSRFYVRNDDFLTSFQEKQMSTQPDFILEYAHYLGNHFQSQGHKNVEVYVESFVSLNGRKSQPFIDPEVNLMNVEDGFGHKDFILPFQR
jgi:hypothetical protein